MNIQKLFTSTKAKITVAVVSLGGLLGLGVANAQGVPQINSSTATTVVTPMVQALLDMLTWFWTNLGATFMWLALIGAIVYAIYRRVHYGKVF
jgi:hypothetical protein